MKKTGRVVLGLALVIVGVIFALNALNITNIDLMFDGWWTVFIIVPCGIGLFTKREKLGNLIGVAIGVLLLLCCQDVLSFALLWKLLVPGLIVIIGLKMVITGLLGNQANDILNKMKAEGRNPKVGCATFSGCNMNFAGERFEGAELTATFGSVTCDLSHAFVDKDCAIAVSATFGAIEILAPQNVNVKVNVNCIFGASSNKTAVHPQAPTIYVTGICMFGGVEVK